MVNADSVSHCNFQRGFRLSKKPRIWKNTGCRTELQTLCRICQKLWVSSTWIISFSARRSSPQMLYKMRRVKPCNVSYSRTCEVNPGGGKHENGGKWFRLRLSTAVATFTDWLTLLVRRKQRRSMATEESEDLLVHSQKNQLKYLVEQFAKQFSWLIATINILFIHGRESVEVYTSFPHKIGYLKK